MAPPIEALTFDCFGTLIDWRAGQHRVLRQLPSTRDSVAHFDDLLEAREQYEQQIQQGEFRSYESVLADSITQAVRSQLEIELPPGEARAFAAGQLGWPAYSDTSAALSLLAASFGLSLLSNCDHETLQLCARKHLGVPIRHFVSAELVQSYKPSEAHWRHFLDLTGLNPQRVLHVSFTAAYDFNTARELGFQLGFVGRNGATEPQGFDFWASAPTLEAFASAVLAKASA